MNNPLGAPNIPANELLNNLASLLGNYQNVAAPVVGQNSSSSYSPIAPTSFLQQQQQQQFLQNAQAQGQNTIQMPNLPSNASTDSLFAMAQGIQALGNIAGGAFDLQRLNAPVGQFPNDEEILIAHLANAAKERISYKVALNNLHGFNNHAGNLWKDHYLDNKDRIDDLVARRKTGAPVIKTLKKPSADHFLARPQSSSSAPAASRVKQEKVKREKTAKQGSSYASASAPTTSVRPSQRTTINSLTSFLSTDDPDAIPETPTRQPIPPTKVVPTGNGNAFTPEDKKYLIDFLLWITDRSPDISKGKVLKLLSRKVPHHTRGSWDSCWKRLPMACKIWDNVRRVSQEGSEDDQDSEEEGSENEGSENEDSESEYNDEDEDEDEGNQAILGGNDQDMGHAGGAITAGDIRAMAKYIAEIGDDWERWTQKMRWNDFSDRYPQRTGHAWAENYRRWQKKVNKLAAKMRTGQAADSSSRKRKSSMHAPRDDGKRARDR